MVWLHISMMCELPQKQLIKQRLGGHRCDHRTLVKLVQTTTEKQREMESKTKPQTRHRKSQSGVSVFLFHRPLKILTVCTGKQMPVRLVLTYSPSGLLLHFVILSSRVVLWLLVSSVPQKKKKSWTSSKCILFKSTFYLWCTNNFFKTKEEIPYFYKKVLSHFPKISLN